MYFDWKNLAYKIKVKAVLRANEDKVSCRNPFLEPTSTKQWGKCFLLKEKRGFELTTKDYESDALHIVPRRHFNLFSQFFDTDNSFTPTAVCAITSDQTQDQMIS